MKYHPKTRKALSAYAAKYLQLYRNHRKHGGDDPKNARWRANFVLMLGVRGNIYVITSERYERISRAYWRPTR